MLEVLKNKVPQCTAMMDGLLSAVQQSHVRDKYNVQVEVSVYSVQEVDVQCTGTRYYAV